jgi:hypothetical protein
MLAFYDTFSGLIPCRIAAVGDWSSADSSARIQLTAGRGAYRRGEWLTVTLRYVVPRRAVFRRAGCKMIRRYSWPAIVAETRAGAALNVATLDAIRAGA